MIKPTHWDENRAKRYHASGEWAGQTLAQRFEEARRKGPAVAAVINNIVMSFESLEATAAAFGTSLLERGVQKGDVVSMQLPNWWEAAVVTLACSRIGAVLNPLQMIYRQSEIRFIMRQCGSKALIVPNEFRGTSYASIANEVAAEIQLEVTVIIARGAAKHSFENLLNAPPSALATVSPNDVFLLLYTSGTTAAPKGVLHTHNTLMRSAEDLAVLFEVGDRDRVFMASPVTHITGLLLGFVMPWTRGAGTVLLDNWDPETALDLIVKHGCSFTGGAPPFIRGLIDSVQKRGMRPDQVPLVRGPCGGADVAPSLIRDAAHVLGARFTRIYGSTEGVTVTGSKSSDPFEYAAETDGLPLPGHEIIIVNERGEPARPGETGEVLVRGPSNFVGYFDAALNADSFTADSFFRMEDLAQWDENGCIRIQGRKKDIIIRNGENIAAKEVEDLLLTNPLVKDVALVGVPDRDTGERACAYVVPTKGSKPTLDDLCRTLGQAQIAKQKYPEYIVLVDALPKTASGKVQKFKLREDAKIRKLKLRTYAPG